MKWAFSAYGSASIRLESLVLTAMSSPPGKQQTGARMATAKFQWTVSSGRLGSGLDVDLAATCRLPETAITALAARQGQAQTVYTQLLCSIMLLWPLILEARNRQLMERC